MMNKFLAALLLSLICTVAHSQTTQLYNSSGQVKGWATTTGATTQYYGANGQPLGSSRTSGATTQFYGESGQATGYMTSPLSIPSVMDSGDMATKAGQMSKPLEYQGNGEWK